MLIGFDASRLGVGQRTGTEHYTWELLGALGKLDRRNSYRLYTNGRPAALPPLPPNYEPRSMRFSRLWTHLRLSAEMLFRPPDVLFVPAHVLPLWSPRRAVVTIHDLGYLYYPEAHPRTRRLYLRLSTLWNAWRATRIIAISEATKRDIVRHCRVPASKIEVVPHGVDARFRPVSDPEELGKVRERYGTGPAYVLCVGTVQPRKNLVRLIEAWAEYVKHAAEPAPTLVLAGKQGWLAEAIYRRPRELGIGDRVRFTGYVEGDDLPALISGAVAYVMPSLYEGFGMPILEAQACGTPVLASPISSLAEAAGDAALFVDPLDVGSIAGGIARIVEDVELRAQLRERGLRRVTSWTWERTARETLRVLEAVDQPSPANDED